MRLLNTATLKFERSLQLGLESDTRYAVLSHRWAKDNESEVLYDDIVSNKAHEKPCFHKVKAAAEIARSDGYDWIWIDTCCINKQSSAELTESINSMYLWYKNAGCCYAYLEDVHRKLSSKSFHESEWFERGWTLQELLGPSLVKFYGHNWMFLGTKEKLAAEVSDITGIDCEALQGKRLQTYSVAQKMSWTARRKTTLPEDLAYCLLGVFDVNIVPIYGEGARKAFFRLQEEIIKHDDDHSIFAWSMERIETKLSGLLAPDPHCFQNCSAEKASYSVRGRDPFSTTNRGLAIHLEVTPWAADTYLAFIDSEQSLGGSEFSRSARLGIFLRRLSEDDQYARINFDGRDGIFVDEARIYRDCHDEFTPRPVRKMQIFVRHSLDTEQRVYGSSAREDAFRIPRNWFPGPLLKGDDKVQYKICLDEVWHLKVLDLRIHAEFKQLAVGFDFEFNPICLLADITARERLTSPIIVQDSIVEGAAFLDIVENRVYCKHANNGNCKGTHDGIWRLRGHRSFGLDVVLLRSFNDSGPIVVLQRTEDDPLVWVLEIDPPIVRDKRLMK